MVVFIASLLSLLRTYIEIPHDANENIFHLRERKVLLFMEKELNDLEIQDMRHMQFALI